MIVIGLESASVTASVAVWKDGTEIASFKTNYKKTHSETLLPLVDRALQSVSLRMKDVDGVAVSEGPGSFTGLRIGAATAKGLAFAIGKPILAVPTLDAIAHRFYGSGAVVVPLMDARRGEAYTGLYRFDGKEMENLTGPLACPVEEIVLKAEEVASKDGLRVLYTGDGLPVFREKIRSISKTEPLFAPEELRDPDGGAVASIGAKMLSEGKTVSAESFVPLYLRMSQAERERLEKGLSILPEGPETI